jgi:hypothetical protein
MAPDPLGREHASTVLYDPAKFVTPNGYFAGSNLTRHERDPDNETMQEMWRYDLRLPSK